MTPRSHQSCSEAPESDSSAYSDGRGTDVVAHETGVTKPGEPSAGEDDGDQPLRIRAELIAVSGSEGEALEAGQLAVIREILLWRHRNTDPPIAME
jgi:hypothetical protein